MSHYFTDNSEMHHNRKEITFRFLGISYTFVTDAGVFSRDSVDFGTTLLIRTACETGLSGNEILDLGCGYGPVGIILQKALGVNVLALDINPRAIQLTEENAIRNQCSVRVGTGDGISVDERFTDILTNPPIRAGKEVIYRLFHEAYEHLVPEGCLWVVIRKKQGADSALKELDSIFSDTEILARKKGYVIIRCRKAN